MLTDALSGLTVLDFGQLIAGPVAAMWLADLGATVIKVEPPGGELARRLGPPWQRQESLTALTSNRNKLGLCVDLKKPDGIDIVRRIVRKVDIVIENFRPGVAERLGIDHASLSLLQPALITCSLSAFGQHGPWRERPGVDGILQAASGIMSIIKGPDGTPGKVPLPFADMTAAMFATIAILSAVRKRDVTGQGSHLDISLYNSMLMIQQLTLAGYLGSGEPPQPTGSAAPYAALNEAVPTSDGWIMIAAYQEPRWQRLCQVIGRCDLLSDRRFATNRDRVSHRAELRAALDSVFRSKPTQHWLALLQEADIIVAPVANYEDVTRSDQYAASGIEIEIEHASAGRFRMPGFGLDGPAPPASPPPLVGEHSRDILARFEFTAAEIDSLISDGIVFTGDRS
ncbi:CoA transferase [Bradyrhizobium tropiciagri]|uniref:CaiB/BaiF CoA transferase family protein n=1 Tax=Bradyrhizobium tropiciagri TaxID=312253 RepID=UPI001BA7D1BA|nr:CoA transferase [Bradyrhizobium tropiciagri]MBR0869652.1 CoA transferase [Bradyrhizobium tropiciagri]